MGYGERGDRRNANVGEQCPGWPDGYPCPVIVKDRMWCHGCTARRQEAIARGLPDHAMTPVAIILQDFDAPQPMCACGGDPTENLHRFSLRHIEWGWKQSGIARENGVQVVRLPRGGRVVHPWTTR